MSGGGKSISASFHDDLKDYLLVDQDADVGKVREHLDMMLQRYPWDVTDGRIEFFPYSRGGGHLVKLPSPSPDSRQEEADHTFESKLAEYLRLEAEEKGYEALLQLVELRDDYEFREDGSSYHFSPEGYVTTTVSVPSLESLAASHRERGMEGLEGEEKTVIEMFMNNNYYIGGTMTASIYRDNGHMVVLDEDPDAPGLEVEMKDVDHLAEAVPMMDIFDVYQTMKSGYEEDARRPMELLWEYYMTGHAEGDAPSSLIEVFHDPLDGTVLLYGDHGDGPNGFRVRDESVLSGLEPVDTDTLYNDLRKNGTGPGLDELLDELFRDYSDSLSGR